MKDAFEELMDIARKNRKLCPWIKKRDSKEYCKEVLLEAQELVQALEKEDYKNLQEELGDVLWDLMMLTIIAEEEGKVDAKGVIKDVIAKIKRRKPFIIEGKKVTLEEAKKIWFEAKNKEKHNKY